MTDAAETFFHTAKWTQIVEAAYGYRDRSRTFQFAGGASARLPLSEMPRRLGVLRRLMSVPRGYGSLAAGDGLQASHIHAVHAHLRRWCLRGATIHLVGNPLRIFLGQRDAVLDDLPPPHERFNTATHLLSLREGFDAIWKDRFDKKARNQYRKAEASGVTISMASTRDQFRAFYDVYLASNKRWGVASPSVAWELYEHVLRIAPENAVAWLAHHPDGSPAAGAVCLYHHASVVLWSSALHKEFAALRPNDLLYAEMIRHACGQGYQVFDFGSSEGLPGVQAFKEQFGPKQVTVPHVILAHPLAIALRRLRR